MGRVSLHEDAMAAKAYGEEIGDDYGGLYGGDKLTVLFTAKLAHHEAELRRRVPHPDQVQVRLSRKPHRGIQAASLYIRDRFRELSRRRTGLRYEGAGGGAYLGEDGEFHYYARIRPFTEDRVREVRELLKPYDVTIADGDDEDFPLPSDLPDYRP